MQIQKRVLLLLSSLFVLASCRNTNPASSDDLQTSSAQNKKMTVKATVGAFYQYDLIDYSSFEVKDLSNNTAVVGFKVFYEGEELADKKDRILSFGKVKLYFEAEGYGTIILEINVKKSPRFNEELVIEQAPTKTSYKKGEAFSKEGLKVYDELTYTRADGQPVSQKEECLDYSIQIDGMDAANYVFQEENHTIRYALISAKGLDGSILTTSVPLTILSSVKNSTNPKYDDKEEQYKWETSEKKMKVRFSSSKKDVQKAYYSPDEVNLDFNLNSFMNKECTTFRQTPSLGEVPLLVIPVVLNGFEEQATEENHKKIESAFFGKSKEGEIPCSSLASYYYYSSFQQLKFTGAVTPYFNPVKEGFLGYSNPYNFSLDTPSSLANDALKWAKEKLSINLDDYDSDNDGYVDGVWLIYMEDPSNSFTGNVSAFWPFTSAASVARGTKENPALNTYSWTGAAHLYGKYGISSYLDTLGYDPHVLEHETGHLLGLNDYYSYDSNTAQDTYYSPLGKMDMMDKDFGDHNPYSKMLLGWIKPYVVLGDCEIEIPSSQIQNSVFLLPYDDKTYSTDEFGRIILNPFDEYLLLDYYSYSNLYKDTFEQNTFSYQFPTEEGGRLYHIDARALEYSNNSFFLPEDPDEVMTSSESFFRGITNTQSGERAESNYNVPGLNDYFDEVRWISKDGKKVDGNAAPSNSSLFKVGDSFSFDNYKNQFVNDKLDNGKNFSTTFKILSIV